MTAKEIQEQLERTRKVFLNFDAAGRSFVAAANEIQKFGVSIERCAKVFSNGLEVSNRKALASSQ